MSIDTEDTLSEESIKVLGELSRGISHDLKNFLTAIQGNAEMAMRSHDKPETVDRALGMVIRACMSARDLCNQVLAYSQEKALPRSVFDLRDLMDEAKTLIEPVKPNKTTLEFEPGESAQVIEASHSQVLQIFLNLIGNAMHALADRPGSITVTLDGDDETCSIIVTDNGPGIAREHHDQLFQPGYTTKVYGLATGLGLALVKRITEDHQGTVELESDAGQGCRFQVRLPRSGKPAESLQVDSSAIKAQKTKYNILLVDDEEFMRSLGVDILQSLGYRVSVCDSAKVALELLKKNPEYFDIILSDSRMPEMTGEQFAEEVQGIRPEMPFVLVTAFAVSENKDALKTRGITTVVAKPFLIEDLRQALDFALGTTP